MAELKRLAIVTTHPIQYNAPFFRALTQSGKVLVKVFYTWDKGSGKKHDPGFCQQIEWDIPLLEGYEYAFVKNTSKEPGSHHFLGIHNPTLINEIKDYRPDVVLVYGWSFRSNLKVMHYFKGKVPVWFRGDSHLLDEELGLKTFLRRVFLKWVYKHVDKAFYVGSNNKVYYLAHGLKEEQLVFMPHVVDNDSFAHDCNNREKQALEWRRSLRIADEDFVVLFAGKFEPKKNPVLLVNSVIALNEQITSSNIQISKFPNLLIHLILVGNGILESQLRKLSERKPYIHFLPFQNQSKMPVVYRLGNIFCLPSKGPGETWGLGVNEALACGRKAIVSEKVGCAPDLINNKSGCIFSNNDYISLSKAINTISHSETKFMGTNLLPDNFTIFSNVNILNQFFY
ncbi:MAG: glycosyltransferase family 4 protein [Bacteroidia bacterium]|nr:glycosyltransferase family 4 protein [Bacteroidia bacterium]